MVCKWWIQKLPKLNSKMLLSFPLHLSKKQSHMWRCHSAPTPVWKIPSTEGIRKSSHLFLSLCPLGTEKCFPVEEKTWNAWNGDEDWEGMFKNPLRGAGTKTHMNNTSKILRRKPGCLYSCQILARSLILLRLQLLAYRLGHTQERKAFPSAAPTLLSATL